MKLAFNFSLTKKGKGKLLRIRKPPPVPVREDGEKEMENSPVSVRSPVWEHLVLFTHD